MDARTQAWIDQDHARTVAIIRRHGWMIQYVGGGTCGVPGCTAHDDADSPPFAYTVGMFGLGHPEFLVFDLPPEGAAELLNELGRMVRSGENLIPGQMLEPECWDQRVVLEEVPNPGDIVFAANRFYQRPPEFSVPVLQVTYDDFDGRFPWDEGYDEACGAQPRPGRFKA
ncbi:MAG: DUF4262 domain-containing protein [Acidimicrobiales bacterium]|jgi:hypothetical protein|nr:DUF4262 domain-containing protein [Acidimicrobiales bacterium]HLV91104.1 DUF4262 domain-containing protein [Acidimicrobiia bacterium]